MDREFLKADLSTCRQLIRHGKCADQPLFMRMRVRIRPGVRRVIRRSKVTRVLADRAARAAAAEVVTTAAVPAGTLTASSAGLAHTAAIG